MQLLVWLLSLLAACTASAQTLEKITTPHGIELRVWHFLPQNADSKPRPVVIALHGCGGLYATLGARKGMFSARHQAMGEMLAGQGYHVLFPDSFKSRGVEGICSEADRLRNGIRIDMPERRADVLATLEWARRQAWADTPRNNIAILGWSHGAMTLLATTDKNTPAVAATKPFKTAIAFYPGCVNALRQNYAPNAPLALLLGSDDDWTLPQPCIDLATKLKTQGEDVFLKVYEGAVHGFDNPVSGVRELKDIPSRKANARTGEGVKAGQHPEARQDSWGLVQQRLKQAFSQ